MIAYETWREILRGERLPAALVDLDAFDRNARKMAEIASSRGKRLRLATKSVRVPQLIKRVLEQGGPFRGLMCYSAEEALFLAEQGLDDFLVAYPTVQRSDLAALRELHARGKEAALIVDHVDQLRALSEAMSAAKDPRLDAAYRT